MKILERLSSSSGRRDNEQNRDLAKQIAAGDDRDALDECAGILKHSKDRRIQSDCIKVLYETGYIKPALIAPYFPLFLELLASRNNRLVWGAMIALRVITEVIPEEIYGQLPVIIEATEKGSVITNDNGIGILTRLYGTEKFSREVLPLLEEQLRICPARQLPLYAERLLPFIKREDVALFTGLFAGRLNEIEKESRRKRLQKLVEKMNKISS